MEAKTKHGRMYSDLSYILSAGKGVTPEFSKWMVIKHGDNDMTSSITLTSKHGDIFLRKRENP